MIDCNEWRTQKRHECANMGKVKRLELWWQLYRPSFPVWDLENFRPMDFCWHECTTTRLCDTRLRPCREISTAGWFRNTDVLHGQHLTTRSPSGSRTHYILITTKQTALDPYHRNVHCLRSSTTHHSQIWDSIIYLPPDRSCIWSLHPYNKRIWDCIRSPPLNRRQLQILTIRSQSDLRHPYILTTGSQTMLDHYHQIKTGPQTALDPYNHITNGSETALDPYNHIKFGSEITLDPYNHNTNGSETA